MKVFNSLVNELLEVTKKDKEEFEELYRQSTQYLLGALLHRYFRLHQKYDDWNKPSSKIPFLNPNYGM